MFEATGVMTKKELEARNEVKWETYTKKIQIEARVLGDLAMNHIIPVATQYQTDLIDNVYKMQGPVPRQTKLQNCLPRTWNSSKKLPTAPPSSKSM